MVLALIFCFTLRWLSFYVTNLSKNNPAVTPLVYAVPIGFGLICAYMLMTNRQLAMPRFISQPLGRLSDLARRRLAAAGVPRVDGGGFDTFADPRFYSYRRDGARSGRFASFIWLD